MCTQPEKKQSDPTLHRTSCCQNDLTARSDELWQMLQPLMTSPAECVVLVESFVYGFTPRIIRDRHPQLFPDILMIYRIKRAVLEHLQGHPELLQLFDLNS